MAPHCISSTLWPEFWVNISDLNYTSLQHPETYLSINNHKKLPVNKLKTLNDMWLEYIYLWHTSDFQYTIMYLYNMVQFNTI